MTESLTKLKQRLEHGGGKVLIIQTAFLGDVILITPLIRAVKNLFPQSRVTTLTLPEWSGVISGLALEALTIDKNAVAADRDTWRRLVADLRRRSFDAAIIPHRSFRSGLTARRAHIPVRIGFDRGGGSIFHTHRVKYPAMQYEGRRNLELLKIIAPTRDQGIPELGLSSDERHEARVRLESLGLQTNGFVVFAPGSIWKSKRWDVGYYKQLGSIIRAEHGLPAVAVGGAGDSDLCREVVGDEAMNLAGKLSPRQSAAVIAESRFIVSGDTAPAHLATAVGARQVIIFGSTAPRLGFAPPTDRARIAGIDLWCRPCSGHGRNYCPRFGSYKCLSDIHPANILDLVKDWL